MTAESTAAPAGPGHRVRRLWGAPLWAHAVVLLVVLVGLGALVRPGFASTSDEGAAVVQARLLQHGTWIYDNRLPAVDPDGADQPFPSGDIGTKGLAPYAKHPLFPELLRVAADVGGNPAMVLVGILGTLGAAVAAALIAGWLRASLVRPTLWIMGLGSPLLFDAYVIVAHSLAAAGIGFAALASLHVLHRVGARRVLALVLVAGLVAVSVALRTEAVFAGLGLAIGAGVVAWLHRRASWRPAAVLAVVVAAATVATVLIEHEIRLAIVGTTVAAVGEPVGAGDAAWLPGRFEALWNDWFDPGLGGISKLLVVAMIATTVMLAFGAVKARRSGPDVLVAAAGFAAVVYVVRLASSPPVEIFGLMVAFPLLWAGAWLVRRPAATDPTRVFLVVTTLALTIGVLLTDYPLGGSIEWGGRYFAIGLPLAVPLAVEALARLGRSMREPVTPRRVGAVALAVVTVATSVLALRVLRVRHDAAASLHRAVVAAAAEAGPVTGGDEPGPPVVLVGNRLLPQYLYDDLLDHRWLAAGSDASMRDAAARAATAGIDRMVVVGPPADLADWSGWRQVSRRSSSLGSVAVIERCPSTGC